MTTLKENTTVDLLRFQVKDFCDKGTERRRVLEDIGNQHKKLSARKKDDQRKKELKENIIEKGKVQLEEKIQVDLEKTKVTPTIIDIDRNFESNLFLVSAYSKDVYNYLMQLEKKKILPKWPLKNTNIDSTMRYKLVNWLLEVQTSYSLLQETFQICVSIIDQYLSTDTELTRETLQLLGVAALSLACKYEELHPISLRELVNLCDSTYTLKEIASMEIKVLKALDFNLSRPVCITFLRRFSMAAFGNKNQHTFSKYFVDVALFQANICHLKSSLIASAATFISLVVTAERIDSSLWTATLVTHTQYTVAQILPVVRVIAKSIQQVSNSKHKNVFVKYASTDLAQVSTKASMPPICSLIKQLCDIQINK